LTVAEKLASRAREGSAGASAYQGFTYQHHLTLCKVLEVQESGADYEILVDHHDDVIVWRDPPDGPVECIQVKRKRAGNWTSTLLTKREGATLSPLGKLYHHALYFEDAVAALHFVSNAPFSVGPLTDGSDSKTRVRILCGELRPSELDRIKLALRQEHGLDEDPLIEEILILSTSDIPLTAYEDHTLSKVTRLLEGSACGAPIRPTAAYKALMGEVERRAALEADTLPPAEAYRRKVLSKQQVSAMLDEMIRSARSDPWPLMAAGLERAGWSALRVSRIGRAYRSLAAKRTLASGHAINEALERAAALLLSIPESTDAAECLTLLMDVIESDRTLLLSEDEIASAAAEVLYDA